jgi:hypothetical protein
MACRAISAESAISACQQLPEPCVIPCWRSVHGRVVVASRALAHEAWRSGVCGGVFHKCQVRPEAQDSEQLRDADREARREDSELDALVPAQNARCLIVNEAHNRAIGGSTSSAVSTPVLTYHRHRRTSALVLCSGETILTARSGAVPKTLATSPSTVRGMRSDLKTRHRARRRRRRTRRAAPERPERGGDFRRSH